MGCKSSKIAEENDREAQSANPFQLFPKEIWQAILLQVTESDDLLSTVEAFPQLKKLVSNRAHLWLIDDILPLIMPKYLTFNDLRTCRRICKRWNFAVDSSLETYPDRHPYKSDQVAGMTLQHFNYKPAAIDFKTNFERFVAILNDVKGIKRRNYNPFPGRLVRKNLTAFDIKSAALMEQFGHCIWYLEIYFPFSNPNEACSVLGKLYSQCLPNLPNIRSLKISGEILGDLNCNDLLTHVLPKLETLHISGIANMNQKIHDNLMVNLARHRGVRKLAINMEFWKKKYSVLLPNLIELELTASTVDFLHRIKTILKQMQSSQLQKLHLLDHPYANIFDILEVLLPYKLESLVLRGPMNEKIPKNMFVLPTILELNVGVHQLLKYKFFQCLPALEYLTVGKYQAFETHQKSCYDPVNMSLRTTSFDPEEEREDTRKNIWEELPNLKMLLVQGRHHYDDFFEQYVREAKKTKFGNLVSTPQLQFYRLVNPFYDIDNGDNSSDGRERDDFED